MLKFIHTGDWQLGKSFGRFDQETRIALGEARFDAIDAIGDAATKRGIVHVLVAGDAFDTEGPSDRTIVQAVSRMDRHPCRWWLLPGNHDYARNGGLWARVRGKAGKRITVLSEAEACEIEEGCWLLPAPLANRHNLDDPTALYDGMETPGARLRVGLAHGSVRDFGSQGETRNQIAPDRARRSGLDYLALGDWHGTVAIDRRTWYSGTPEVDRFQRDEPGQVLAVTLTPEAEPEVTPVRTGRFQWLVRDWTVGSGEALNGELDRLLAGVEPAATLLRLSLAGIVRLSDRIAILNRLEHHLRHQLRHLELFSDDLVGRPTDEDLADLAIEGMLGAAATRLRSRIDGGGPEGAVARRALERLFVEHERDEVR